MKCRKKKKLVSVSFRKPTLWQSLFNEGHKKDFFSVFPTFTSGFGEIRVLLRNLEVTRILAQDKRLYSDTSANEDNSFRNHIR